MSASNSVTSNPHGRAALEHLFTAWDGAAVPAARLPAEVQWPEVRRELSTYSLAEIKRAFSSDKVEWIESAVLPEIFAEELQKQDKLLTTSYSSEKVDSLVAMLRGYAKSKNSFLFSRLVERVADSSPSYLLRHVSIPFIEAAYKTEGFAKHSIILLSALKDEAQSVLECLSNWQTHSICELLKVITAEEFEEIVQITNKEVLALENQYNKLFFHFAIDYSSLDVIKSYLRLAGPDAKQLINR